MAKRSGKFYYRNEKEVMAFLGLQTVPGSGSGWVHKEDGESDTVMVQLKSTDADSYKIKLFDVKQLEYHASVSHKVPIFLIQFLKQDKLYAMVEVGNIEELFQAFKFQKAPEPKIHFVEQEQEEMVNRKTIKSSKQAREQFFNEREEQENGKRKRKR